uniref:uncharacterized protein n=1 Tax=Myxine glutinosa TaxID=7769 RepID=UPI00358E3D0F
MCAMKGDVSIVEHRTNPPGWSRRSGSDGGNGVSPGRSPGDEECGPDFIVKVKVETEFIDEFSFIKDEAPLVKMETFQSNSLQTSQDTLSNVDVKQESCDSPPAEPSKAEQLLEVKQMELVSCSYCSQFFCSEVLNHHMTHTDSQKKDAFHKPEQRKQRKSVAKRKNDGVLLKEGQDQFREKDQENQAQTKGKRMEKADVDGQKDEGEQQNEGEKDGEDDEEQLRLEEE